jgi:fluoride exporter
VAALVANLTGSLLLGFYIVRREASVTRRWSLQFWAIGVLGSFTTFSTFTFDFLQLIQAQRLAVAVVYLIVSLSGGLALAWIGQQVGKGLS